MSTVRAKGCHATRSCTTDDKWCVAATFNNSPTIRVVVVVAGHCFAFDKRGDYPLERYPPFVNLDGRRTRTLFAANFKSIVILGSDRSSPPSPDCLMPPPPAKLHTAPRRTRTAAAQSPLACCMSGPGPAPAAATAAGRTTGHSLLLVLADRHLSGPARAAGPPA